MPDRYEERDIPVDEYDPGLIEEAEPQTGFIFPSRRNAQTVLGEDELIGLPEQPVTQPPMPRDWTSRGLGFPLPPDQIQRQGYGVLEKYNPETGQRETFTVVNPPGTRLPQFPIPRPRRDPMEEMRKTINAIQFQKANDAYKAALSFQAARAYRQDLDAGKSQGEALARWGHLLPGGLAGAAAMTRESRPIPTPQVVQTPSGPAVRYGRYGEQMRVIPPSGTATARDIEEATRLRREGMRLRREGKIPEAEEAEYGKTLYESKFTGPNESIEVTPGGVLIKKGSKSTEGPTVAFKTRLQEQLHNYDSAMEVLDHITRNMNASDFGVRGVAKELWSKIGGQLGADVNPEDMDIRKSVGLLRSSLYKTLRSDSNIAEAERKQIEGMLPSLGPNESLTDAIASLNAVKRRLQGESARAAKELGVAPPEWAKGYEDRVKEAFKSKRLSEEQALKAIQTYRMSGNESPIP